MAPVTLYFLQSSRAIRIAWLLEELSVEYELVYSERDPLTGLAPTEFARKIGTRLAKSPTIKHGDLVLSESGAISEYLCEKFDLDHRLIPSEGAARFRVLEWIHASEGTFMLHALAIMYARSKMPDANGSNAPVVAALEEGMSKNVQDALDWLESELGENQGKYLFGENVTAADCILYNSIEYIMIKQLGTRGKKWERIEQYMKDCQATATYRKAVEKTGYHL